MTEPIVEMGEIVTTIELDLNRNIIIKKLRRIYTNAIKKDHQIDEKALQNAVKEAIQQTENDKDIDGCDLKPLSEKPS